MLEAALRWNPMYAGALFEYLKWSGIGKGAWRAPSVHSRSCFALGTWLAVIGMLRQIGEIYGFLIGADRDVVGLALH